MALNRSQQLDLLKQARERNPNLTRDQATELLNKANQRSQAQPQDTTGDKNWLTEGATTNLGRAGRAAINLLSVPSYFVGGIAKESREGAERGEGVPDPFSAAAKGVVSGVRGVKEKSETFEEAPKLLGLDPESAIGTGVGLVAELAVPDPSDAVPVSKAISKGYEPVKQLSKTAGKAAKGALKRVPGQQGVKTLAKMGKEAAGDIISLDDKKAMTRLFNLDKLGAYYRDVAEKKGYKIEDEAVKYIDDIIPEGAKTIGEVKQKMNDTLVALGSSLEQKLKNSNKKVDVTGLNEKIAKRIQTLSGGTQKDVEEANKLMQEYKSFLERNNNGLLDPLSAQKTKSSFYDDLFSEKSGRKKSLSTAEVDFKDMMAQEIRKQLKGIDGVQEIMKEYEVIKDLQRGMARGFKADAGVEPSSFGITASIADSAKALGRDPETLITQMRDKTGVAKIAEDVIGAAQRISATTKIAKQFAEKGMSELITDNKAISNVAKALDASGITDPDSEAGRKIIDTVLRTMRKGAIIKARDDDEKQSMREIRSAATLAGLDTSQVGNNVGIDTGAFSQEGAPLYR